MSKIAPSHTSHRNAPDCLLRLVWVKYTMFQETGAIHSGSFARFLSQKPEVLCLQGLSVWTPAFQQRRHCLNSCLCVCKYDYHCSVSCLLPCGGCGSLPRLKKRETMHNLTWLQCSCWAGNFHATLPLHWENVLRFEGEHH